MHPNLAVSKRNLVLLRVLFPIAAEDSMMKRFACLTVLFLVAPAAAASAVEDSAPSKTQVIPEENVEGSKPQRCWPARNVGIAETSKDYYASCQQQGSEEIPAEPD